MRVDVDETRRHHVSGRIDFLPALAVDFADGGNHAVLDGNVARDGLTAGAVDN